MLYDLGILWEWKYDERFVRLVDAFCQRSGKTSYLVWPRNFNESMAQILSGELRFRVILDRATDSEPAFMPIVRLHQEAQSRIINEPEKAVHTHSRALMHLEFMNGGVNVPYTLMLSPNETIDEKGLEVIGRPFVIKPVEGEGGGEGVFLGAKTVNDVERVRKQYPGTQILIQENIVPGEFNKWRCWFRVFYICGNVIPCFWDDLTHIYRRLAPEEEMLFSELKRITEKIHEIIGLEFFSTEIVRTEDGKFVVVDYVNDQCDMRFQSDTPDGVPDSVVEEIAKAIVEAV
jgi:glutathione synthase/RimK-type ligase-like ATP-grasp enzyme